MGVSSFKIPLKFAFAHFFVNAEVMSLGEIGRFIKSHKNGPQLVESIEFNKIKYSKNNGHENTETHLDTIKMLPTIQSLFNIPKKNTKFKKNTFKFQFKNKI